MMNRNDFGDALTFISSNTIVQFLFNVLKKKKISTTFGVIAMKFGTDMRVPPGGTVMILVIPYLFN